MAKMGRPRGPATRGVKVDRALLDRWIELSVRRVPGLRVSPKEATDAALRVASHFADPDASSGFTRVVHQTIADNTAAHVDTILKALYPDAEFSVRCDAAGDGMVYEVSIKHADRDETLHIPTATEINMDALRRVH